VPLAVLGEWEKHRMSKSSHHLVALAVLLVGLRASAAAATVEVPEPRVDTFVAADGASYFAVSLSPNVAVPRASAHDIVILFDTSASQTSLYREKALAALEAMLSMLPRGNRVQLLAVDLEAVPLTDSFVAPQSPEMEAAIAALKSRAPLGATDMPEVLRAAAARFGEKASGRKALVYIGDGMSTAHFMSLDEYRKLSYMLVDLRIPLSAYAVGPRVDSPLLASLANLTGGVLAVDGEEVGPKEAGLYLASACEATVLWPRGATWPKEFVDVYPQRVPPLRSDRDSIVIGKAKAPLAGELQIGMTVEADGKPLSLRWTLPTDGSNADFGFLPSVVERCREDGGLRLITVGTLGLNETRRLLNESAEQLAKLSGQAIAAGNLDAAERLADEALRHDPLDETALGVKKEVAKLRAPAAAAKADEPIEIRRFTNEQAAPPKKATSVQFRRPVAVPEPPVPDPPADVDVNDAQGRLLSAIEQQNRLVTALVRTEVENELREARSQMATDPLKVEQSLKLMMERVMKSPEVNAEVRAQLRAQLETALREANRRAATKDIIDQQIQEARAAAIDRLRIADGLARDQERLKQLMDRFNSLMEEGRYVAADDIGTIEVPKIDPTLPIATSASIEAHLIGARQADLVLRQARAKAVVETLGSVEVSMMPFPDDQPVVYPDAPVWQELTDRRKRYVRTDLKTVGAAEKKIRKALDEPTSFEFFENSLQDVVDYLKEYHDIEIQLDTKTLADAGQGSDTQVTRKLSGISLRSALRLLLGGLDGLTYIIKDEVLLITTKEVADAELITKAYPVADLVIPIQSMGGGMGGGMMGGMGGGMMGGMGGGMGGGMMGGMGGGMGGGMMGGMGGMGGGMGGGMMGGGMGMMSVPADKQPIQLAAAEDLKLQGSKKASTSKSEPAPKPTAKTAKQPASVTIPNGISPAPRSSAPKAAQQAAPAAKAPVAKAPVGQPAHKAEKIAPIVLNIAEGTDPDVAWNDYFAAHPDVKPEAVRETVRTLVHDRKVAQVISIIQAALRNGLPQPWMYEALALAMQANGSSKPQVERALMSGVDFGEGAEDLMYVAQYMARSGLESRALKIFRQVAVIEPLRPEPYLYGLHLAQTLNDIEGIKWSSLGILKQAWPKDKQDLVRSATRSATAVLAQLKAENRTAEAQEFAAELDKAKIRDCVVKVTWTGDADVDLLVEEPSGSTASFRNPRTAGGGIIVGDAASQDKRKTSDGLTETYVCPEAFNGTYRVLVRRVWGKVTAGKVTVDVYAHAGTPEEKHLRHQIPLGDDDALVVFDLEDGRRKEAISEHLLANAAAGQMAVNQAVLAQQVQSMSQTQNAVAGLGVSRQGLLGLPFIQQQVGYMPIIQTLPSGAGFRVNGVVSADRRYVRISPAPTFTGVGSVTTFNIQSGQSGTQPGPGAGGTQPGQTPPGASQTNGVTGS
jgi:hypothetical protein